MFNLDTVIDREDSFALELFPADSNPLRDELNDFIAKTEAVVEAENSDEEVALSRFMIDLGEMVAEFVESGTGQALQFVRNEEAKLVAIDLNIEETEEGLIYDPHAAEMIMFDMVDTEGNSFKKIFHMLTEQIQTFYE